MGTKPKPVELVKPVCQRGEPATILCNDTQTHALKAHLHDSLPHTLKLTLRLHVSILPQDGTELKQWVRPGRGRRYVMMKTTETGFESG